ncbi:MAG: riboflavin synthase [Myxococcales bacterium]|nr:riboflavin synthase [Myxococcales bacterium]MCB9566216.1 riboflavin synthase [Myxococcales bacterium]MCB9702727.1 riboflavin synthase [Myxococcales bacterium]
MFTGLVQRVGTLAAIEPRAERRRLRIAAALDERDRILGASVAVSGVCLTVVAATARDFEVDAAFETLAVTTLGDLAVGARVNLEPALRIGDALGGHLVSGHVDGVGRLRSQSRRGDAILMWFDAPAELRRYIAAKGSICVDGVSLTVNEIDGEGFAVGLIPHTLAVTTLGDLRPGVRVNLEVDLIARYVERLLSAQKPDGGVTWATLAAAGFGTREST